MLFTYFTHAYTRNGSQCITCCRIIRKKDPKSHRGRTFLSISVLFQTAGTLIWPVITVVTIRFTCGEPPFIMNCFSIRREMNCYSWYIIRCNLIFLTYIRTEVTIEFVCCMGAGFFSFSELCTGINQFSMNKPYDKPINPCCPYCLFLLTRADFLPSLHRKAEIRLGSTGPEVLLRVRKGGPPLPDLCDLRCSLQQVKKWKCFDINHIDTFANTLEEPRNLFRDCIPLSTVTKEFAKDHTPGC